MNSKRELVWCISSILAKFVHRPNTIIIIVDLSLCFRAPWLLLTLYLTLFKLYMYLPVSSKNIQKASSKKYPKSIMHFMTLRFWISCNWVFYTLLGLALILWLTSQKSCESLRFVFEYRAIFKMNTADSMLRGSTNMWITFDSGTTSESKSGFCRATVEPNCN